MYRFFHAVTQPLLEAVAPSIVVEIGSDRGFGTELLANWCAEHAATLHTVDPNPKYDVEEWSARWPDVLVVHQDLSLNALVDIGPVDVVCIDGDHNWYTVFHELEILERIARGAERPFPLTLLHDVAWPYGRRDLYYDPDTIPGAFRHPHRKGGLIPGQRALEDRGFNDHLENAIHEGTPRNGVLTAVEDFIQQRDGDLKLHILPGIHGLGIVLDDEASEPVHKAVHDMLSTEGLLSTLRTVEDDRLHRLREIAELQRRVSRERERVENLRTSLAERAESQRDLTAQLKALRAASEQLRKDRDEKDNALKQSSATVKEVRAALQAAEVRQKEIAQRTQAERQHLETRLRDVEDRERLGIKERDQQIAVLKGKVQGEQNARSKLERDFVRLRGRRSVRLALALARLFRPIFRLRRGQMGRSRSRRQGAATTDAGRPSGERATSPPKARSRESRGDLFQAEEVVSGPFFSIVTELLEAGVPDKFVQDWELSEASARTSEQSLLMTEANPIVSVIMPTYNRADIISDAISTVLAQTYENWELIVCDDGSEDNTEAIVRGFNEPRISYYRLDRGGSARARNVGLSHARGDLIAYLDSDNLWHPHFLEAMAAVLAANPGQYSVYSKYIDINLSTGNPRLKSFRPLSFDYERLLKKNYIDLNAFMHRRILVEHLGGFKEELTRQQDWELILRYTLLRDPFYLDRFLMVYRRNDAWNQITKVFKHDRRSPALIAAAVEDYHQQGLPSYRSGDLPSLTVISWDVCRNHFSKAYNIAEAMSPVCSVQLIGFRFFEGTIFPPYANAVPSFETLYKSGGQFPEWSKYFARVVANIRGDIVYAVKPRLPSLGAALLANYHFGKPIVLEINDLESVVTNPQADQCITRVDLAEVDPKDPELLNPYGSLWTAVLEGLALDIPHRVTHNSVLDRHLGGGAYFLRNPKDERYFDPDGYDRDKIRQALGFDPKDRVILFGGMVRRHKGVFELARLLEHADANYRLLVVGSRDSPDQVALKQESLERVTFLEPLDRNEMAAVNFASDAVVLWLDPDVPASQYQMPYKLTDALAMKVPVFANDIGDLGQLGRQGYLRLVPFGDSAELLAALREYFSDRALKRRMVEAGRRLYLRQFSYRAVRRNLEIIMGEATRDARRLPAALEFAEFFARFYAESRRDAGSALHGANPKVPRSVMRNEDASADDGVSSSTSVASQ